MNNMCYLHNCTAAVYKGDVLIDKAYTSYSVCRNNDIVFKSFGCKNNNCCNGCKKIHFYIKNCTCKTINNTQLKINVCTDKGSYCYLSDLNQINPGEVCCVSEDIDLNTLCKAKVLSELTSCNDVIAKSCVYL